MNNPQQPQLNIDFSKTTAEICEKCENDTFQQVFKMRTFACAKCGHVNKGFQPKETE